MDLQKNYIRGSEMKISSYYQILSSKTKNDEAPSKREEKEEKTSDGNKLHKTFSDYAFVFRRCLLLWSQLHSKMWTRLASYSDNHNPRRKLLKSLILYFSVIGYVKESGKLQAWLSNHLRNS